MIHGNTAGLKHLESVRNGTFKKGHGIDCDLDKHLRFKRSNLVVMAGHANVGKTLSILFYFVCLAHKHELKFAIFSSENEIGDLLDDLITLYTGKQLTDLNEQDYQQALYFINCHFRFFDADGFFIIHKRLMNFKDILEVVNGMHVNEDFNPDALVIDPYNSLGHAPDISSNKHEYDYIVLAELRIWCKTEKKACYILAHGNTEALRKQHTKEHVMHGYSVPLMASDIEGGGKYVNRCDDFVVIHRYLDHDTEWMKTEWHVKKVKNTKTGGSPTFKNNPIVLKAKKNMTGFDVYIKQECLAEPLEWINPMKGKTETHQLKPLEVNTEFDKSVEHAQAVIKQEFKRDEDEKPCPF